MRDPVLEEALRRLAAEAATRFSSLVACGEEVPFDVVEDDGQGAFFYRYLPLTEKFVRAHENDLRSLPSYGPACGAINLAGIAAPFLEARGMPVSPDPDRRAGDMITAFIAELWRGSAEFTLDQSRLDAALAAIEAETRDVHEADLLVAPLVGLQMESSSLKLSESLRIARADTVDAPIEAMSSEGMGRKPWEPQFLALVEQGEGKDAVERALAELTDAITAMRLFRSGGIGLGPYAFAPVAEGEWRRVATAAAPVRVAGYTLDEAEETELAEFVRTVSPRLAAMRSSDGAGAGGPSRWSLQRFEMGRERGDALLGLTDYLLALRAVLEGDGPVGAPLPVRAAALVAPSSERDETRGRIEEALRLERDLIAGKPVEQPVARELAEWFEDAVRRIMRDGVEGALGEDAKVAADESLLSAGLLEGEGSISQRGETDEWDAVPEPVDVGDAEPAGWRPFELPAEAREEAREEARDEGSVRTAEDDDNEEITRIMEPIPNFESEIRITAMRDRGGDEDGAARLYDHEIDADAGFEPEYFEDERFEEEAPPRRAPFQSDWLSEVTEEQGQNTLEWPVIRAYRSFEGDVEEQSAGAIARGRVDSPRVRHLFPVPEDADWTVGELEYNRRRSA